MTTFFFYSLQKLSFNLHLFSKAVSVLSYAVWVEEKFLPIVYLITNSPILSRAHFFLTKAPIAANTEYLQFYASFLLELHIFKHTVYIYLTNASHGSSLSFLLPLIMVSSLCAVRGLTAQPVSYAFFRNHNSVLCKVSISARVW